MRRPKNAYELLGLPRDATSAQVQARYRQLARRLAPKLSVERIFQDPKFRQLTQAYMILMSPERREYDRALRETRGRAEMPDLLTSASDITYLLIAAEVTEIRGQLRQALALCEQALKLDPRDPRACAIMGAIYIRQDKLDDAFRTYNYAVQFAPNDQRYWQMLQDVTALREGRRRKPPISIQAHPHGMATWLSLAGAIAFCVLSMLLFQFSPGEEWFWTFTKRQVFVAALDGLVLGLVLAGTGLIRPADDELLDYSVSGFSGTDMVPVGLFSAFPALLCIWVGIVFYGIVGALDEYFSPSILTSLFVAAGLGAALGLLYPSSLPAFAALGGNFAFAGFLLGWIGGSLRKRVWER